MACSVCMTNCVRLHGDADEDPDEEISPAGSSGPVPKEDGASGPQQKENVPTENFPSFLKKMTELAVTSALVITETSVWFNATELCPAMDAYEIGGIYK